MMEEQFSKALGSFALPPDSILTVALSGGIDSVVLLHLLKVLPQRKFTLQAAHIDHGIRGEEARRDREFCQKLCADWGIPLRIFQGDAPAYAKAHGMSLEQGARALRYGFLDEFSDGKKHFCATAHHREDQQETFFINLYRGSGSGGLSGIKPRRGGYLRPLLGIEKQAILAYGQEKSLPFVTDGTNADTAYLRNFLRHEILPLLNSRAEGRFSEGLAAAMACLAEEDAALNQWADSIQTDRAETLSGLPDAVLKRVLDRQNGAILSRLHFEQIAALIRSRQSAGQIQLSTERYFRLEYGGCAFYSPEAAVEIPLRPDQPAQWQGWNFLLRSAEVHSVFTHFMLDCDKINSDLYLRRKRPGDRFLPAKGQGTSRLQKRLKNDRVPRSARDNLWVLVDGQGNLLWAQGYGAAKDFAPDAATKRVYTLEIGEPNKECEEL